MKNGNGAMFTNVQAIKNLMSQYDKNGDWIDPEYRINRTCCNG